MKKITKDKNLLFSAIRTNIKRNNKRLDTYTELFKKLKNEYNNISNRCEVKHGKERQLIKLFEKIKSVKARIQMLEEIKLDYNNNKEIYENKNIENEDNKKALQEL